MTPKEESTNSVSVFSHDAKISGKNGNTFPFRVVFMLEAAETDGFTDIVSWTGGNSFRVHDQDLFVEQIMPRFFQQTKFKSFQRQCNLWGFDRIPNGPRKGGYTREEHFCRGYPESVGMIKRQKIKGELSKRRRRGASKADGGASTKVTSSLPSKRSTKKRQSSAKPIAVVSNDNAMTGDDYTHSPYPNHRQAIALRNQVYDPISAAAASTAAPPLDMMDIGDLDALDIDLFVNSDDEDMDVVFKDLSKNEDSAAAAAAAAASNENPADAPIVYLDSCESGLSKQSSLIDWLVLEKKTARRNSSPPKEEVAAPLPDSPEGDKPLSPICALLRSNRGSAAAPRSVSPGAASHEHALAFVPPQLKEATFSGSSSSQSTTSETSTKSSQFLSFASRPMAS